MSNFGSDVVLHVPVSFEFDVEVNDDGVSYQVDNVFISESDKCEGWRLELDEVVESLCFKYGDVDGYQYLYVVVDELSWASEALWEKARFIDDSVNEMTDLFDLSDDGT